MCMRHSFILTPSGKVLDGLGVTDHHSAMAPLHGLSPADLDWRRSYATLFLGGTL